MKINQHLWIKKMFLPFVIIILFGMAFLFETPQVLFAGYLNILKSPSILISDYLYIGGISATLFNVATIMLINIVLLRILKLKMNGPIFAGILTIAGFSFFGKNIFNTIPIYVGIYLYSLIKKVNIQSLIIVILFSTGISPIVSFVIFGTGWPLYISIFAGIAFGIVTGFVLPALSANTMKFHQGYNLYNVGFAMGILSTLYAAIFRSLNISLDLGGPSSTKYHYELMVLALILSMMFIIGAFITDKFVLRKYPALLKSSGKLISDYITDYGRPVVLLNVGVMGLVSLLIITLLKFQMGGALMGAVLTVMGFAAYGKHPKNSIPVIFGAYLGVLLTKYSFDSTGVVISILFVTALAPISGRYGVVIGVIAGLIHVVIAPIAFSFQGGFDLYNNGFSAGFVAALMVPVLQVFFKDDLLVPNLSEGVVK